MVITQRSSTLHQNSKAITPHIAHIVPLATPHFGIRKYAFQDEMLCDKKLGMFT